LPVSGLPPALDGLRIGLLTDIHHSLMVPADDVTHAVQLTMSEQPDLIVLGGDYVTFGDRQYVEPVAELLAPLHAPNGVFAILGNHDDDRDMPAALERHQVEVLKDERTRLNIRGEGLELAGIRFWTRGPENISRVVRKRRTPCFSSRMIRGASPKPPRSMCRLSYPATLMAARSSCQA
jgi:predicted MPP superfamily phosphohydrolase